MDGSRAPGSPGGTVDDLQSLDAFTVGIDYGREHATFWVTPAGQSEPVVRMHKDHPYDVAVRPYYVYPVAAPEQLLGYVKMGKAWDAQQTEIGAVGDMRKPQRMHQGPIVQHGLGALTPTRPGVRGTVHKVAAFVEDLVGGGLLTDHDVLDAAIAAHVHCAGPTSQGFELTRRAGVTATYEVVVRDPRVSRLLILAYVDCFNDHSAFDLRHVRATLSTNPLRNITENRRMKLEKQQRERS
ncbi:hypothetical protein [Streptacidiphilus melanogenes]|uniref:hypothetical protein n=1 Tax=Streptacidiphilus melanogenes TaxID=411235 RepID=UPI0005A64DB3|nr:hypothetical protein [Streptacidiphilus melanogenes]